MVTRISPLLDSGQISGQFSYKAGYSGLNLTFRAGYFVRGDVVTSIDETTIALTNNATNWVYIDTNNLILTSDTAIPSEDYILVAKVITASGAISSIQDLRARLTGIVDSD